MKIFTVFFLMLFLAFQSSYADYEKELSTLLSTALNDEDQIRTATNIIDEICEIRTFGEAKGDEQFKCMHFFAEIFSKEKPVYPLIYKSLLHEMASIRIKFDETTIDAAYYMDYMRTALTD